MGTLTIFIFRSNDVQDDTVCSVGNESMTLLDFVEPTLVFDQYSPNLY